MMWKIGVGAIWKYTISKSSETSQAFVAVEVGIRLKLLATIGRMFRQSKKTLCCGGALVDRDFLIRRTFEVRGSNICAKSTRRYLSYEASLESTYVVHCCCNHHPFRLLTLMRHDREFTTFLDSLSLSFGRRNGNCLGCVKQP